MNRCPGASGFISPVILFLVCLLTAPLLGAVALTWEEGCLTEKAVLRHRAGHLAEYALWQWLARADQGQAGHVPAVKRHFGAVDEWNSAPTAGTLGGGRYEITAGYRQDTTDLDGSPLTPLVLYNRGFGFASSPFESGGYPVLDVKASGSVGLHREDLTVSLTYTPFQPAETAALTLAGPALLAGPVVISGSVHRADGTPVEPADEGLPAILCGGALEIEGGASLEDGRPPAPPPPSWLDTMRKPTLILGLPADSRYLQKKAFLGRTAPPWSGLTVFHHNYRGPVRGQGVLVVHNPRFDPVRYTASMDASRGIAAEGYDPSYSHLDPANRPSVLQPEGDCRFAGVIIADELAGGDGRLDVTGQVFQLTRERTVFGMTSGTVIRFSLEALREYAHGECDEVVSWIRGAGGWRTDPAGSP